MSGCSQQNLVDHTDSIQVLIMTDARKFLKKNKRKACALEGLLLADAEIKLQDILDKAVKENEKKELTIRCMVVSKRDNHKYENELEVSRSWTYRNVTVFEVL